MTPIYPSESEAHGEAAALLDAICTASGCYLTDTQQARALSEIEIRLAELRGHWRKRWATYVLEQGRDRGELR